MTSSMNKILRFVRIHQVGALQNQVVSKGFDIKEGYYMIINVASDLEEYTKFEIVSVTEKCILTYQLNDIYNYSNIEFNSEDSLKC